MRFIIFILFMMSSSMYAQVEVFDFHNKEQLSRFTSLNIDAQYPNLLNPSVAKEGYTEIIALWQELHQSMGAHLKKNNFSWGVQDASIPIFQKIYFHPTGAIQYYFFNIRNEAISQEKRKEFSKLVHSFAQTHKIEITQDGPFAQCGKTRYSNH